MLNRQTTPLACLGILLLLPAGQAPAGDEQVWAALKQGGKVVLLRHAHVDIREGMGRLAPGNCAAEVNLSARGVKQARRIGEAFRDYAVPVGEVLTSPYCRCVDTGTLAFGRATPVPYLVPPGAAADSQAVANDARALRNVLGHRGPSNLVMITHTLNIEKIVLESPAMGEFFVVQPDGDDLQVIGKVRISDQ